VDYIADMLHQRFDFVVDRVELSLNFLDFTLLLQFLFDE